MDFLLELLKNLLNAKSSNRNFARLAAIMLAFTLAIVIGSGKYDPTKNKTTRKPSEMSFTITEEDFGRSRFYGSVPEDYLNSTKKK